MHSLNYISTIVKNSFYIFCVNSTCKMWVTIVFAITTCSRYALERNKEKTIISKLEGLNTDVDTNYVKPTKNYKSTQPNTFEL